MNTPSNLLYATTHEWLRVEGEEGYIGITEFAQKELGDIVFFEIDTVGETLEKGTPFGTVEAVKTVSDLLIPVSGEVLEVNPALESSPDLVNKDPYGKGWIIRIKITDNAGKDTLLSAEQYQKLI
jgi:glycine cleavage system H protein